MPFIPNQEAGGGKTQCVRAGTPVPTQAKKKSGTDLPVPVVVSLPARGWDDVIHPQIFHQLSVVVPGVHQVLDSNAQASSCSIWPRRNVGGRNWNVVIVGGCGGAMHMGKRRFQITDDLRLGIR